MRPRRRTRLRILVDILRVLEAGDANVSRLMLEANLSYARLLKYLEELEAKGLVKRVEDGREVRYRITARGAEFLREFDRMLRLAEAFGIEL